jgi:hypothetical protein
MRVINQSRRILPPKSLARRILPRWMDMLSPAVLSAIAVAFLLSFGHAPTHPVTMPQGIESPSPSAPVLTAYRAENSSPAIKAPHSVQLAGTVFETVLICATPRADSAKGLPFATGRQPILCTFKPL